MKKANILKIIKSKKTKPLTGKDIEKILNLKGEETYELYRLLDQMECSGEIVRVKNNRYAIPKELGLVVGKLEVNPRGFGFVIPAREGNDIYIHEEDMADALHGDTVLVRMERARRGRRRPGRSLSGEIIRVIRRGNTGIVGTIKKNGFRLFLVPDNPAFIHDIYIDPSRIKDARPGDKVIVKIIFWPSRRLNPEGEIVEVLGQSGVPQVDTLSVIRQYNLRMEYSREALSETERISTAVSLEEAAARLDLRDLTLFTVDPEDARDFDDAVSLEKNQDGSVVLGVHIADVSHYVKEGSAIDMEARERGTSVYMPERALHMLPPGLSTGICSLRPEEERLAKSVFLTFGPEGERLGYRFDRSIIRSRRRFTYDEVRKILVENDDRARSSDTQITPILDEMAVLARKLRKARFRRGAFDLELPESKIIFNSDGLISDVRLEEADLSHWLIEEFMLAANEAAADFLTARKAPLIYRIHEEPDDRDLFEFAQFAEAFGYTIRNPRNRVEIQKFLDSIRETPLASTLQSAFLRSMKRAEYSAVNIGHYGLACPRYTYFTSPIRRYPDLYIHRLLDNIFNGETFRPVPDLKLLAHHCSENEENSENAERDMLQLRKLQFFNQALKSGQSPVFKAVITRVKNFGIMVYLNRYLLSGLVHVSTLTDDFYKIDRSGTRLKGRRTGKEYAAGDEVTVMVEKVDLEQKRIDFIIFSEKK